MKHIQHLKNKSYFINRYGKLSTSYLFYQMQDIAWEHADILGFGYDKLKEEKQFWVLSRLLVKIERRPRWGENFTLETWPAGSDGFLAYRDYHFIDSEGKSLIKGTSSWIILNAATRRIERFSNFENFPYHKERVFDNFAGKVRPPKPQEDLVYTPVLFNEIDINQHFNTGRYIERIIDSYDFDFHDSHEAAEFEINFLKEGMPDDKLAVRKEVVDTNIHLCSVVRESDGADLIRARMVWRDRKK